MTIVATGDSMRLALNEGPVSVQRAIEASSADVLKIIIQHGRFADGDKNLVQLTRQHRELRGIVYAAAERGLVMYTATGSETRFVRLSHIPVFWHSVVNGSIKRGPEDLLYTLTPAQQPVQAMVVVLSSMAGPFDKASLTRYFEPNFSSISKHLPDSVAVLRIADLDGVVGGFYLPTVNYPKRTQQVSDFILAQAKELGVPTERVVLYGASKGATGALALGMTADLNAIAVDPVVHDGWYEEHYQDTHWTTGKIFLQRKAEAFAELAAKRAALPERKGQLCIVSSPRSPRYPSIRAFEEELERGGGLFMLDSDDERIEDHPHVSMRTLRTVTGLLNMLCQGLPLPQGRFPIFG